MTHTEALDLILSHACPSDEVAQDGTNKFIISVHCVEFEVTARLISTFERIQYEIVGVDTYQG